MLPIAALSIIHILVRTGSLNCVHLESYGKLTHPFRWHHRIFWQYFVRCNTRRKPWNVFCVGIRSTASAAAASTGAASMASLSVTVSSNSTLIDKITSNYACDAVIAVVPLYRSPWALNSSRNVLILPLCSRMAPISNSWENLAPIPNIRCAHPKLYFNPFQVPEASYGIIWTLIFSQTRILGQKSGILHRNNFYSNSDLHFLYGLY